MPYTKKLIEVSLPLEAINAESAREKSIRHGHPSTLHLWWARRPLAACRAVLWASLVTDPSEYESDEEKANLERERLFGILEELVKWENINNEAVLDAAKLEIARSVARDLGCEMPVGKEAIEEFLATKAPPVLDPFAGGGSIPLEAQRLGLRAFASDLNPVAVLINKAMIEIPPKFAGMPPVHPPEESNLQDRQRQEKQGSLFTEKWTGARGLAEDVRYYGKWMRDEAERRIGHLYPKYKITAELLAEREDLRRQGYKPGDELTVIAWLWARTVQCPNPVCGAQMPLVTSFALSTRKGNEAWAEPIINNNSVQFKIKTPPGLPPTAPKIGRGAQFRCLVCGQTASEISIRSEFKAKRNQSQLMAVVAEGVNRRVYLHPTSEHVLIALSAKPSWAPDEEMNMETPSLVSGRGYGISHWSELFTDRQLTILTTLCDLLEEVKPLIKAQASPSMDNLDSETYANSVITYLAFVIDKLSDKSSTLSWWMSVAEKMAPSFSRQALAMVWDYAEMNPFCNVTSNFLAALEMSAKAIEFLPLTSVVGKVEQKDAASIHVESNKLLISTDPPYYDNISYADLSDFFYIWLRRALEEIYPDIFATMMVPKRQELIASPPRFNGNSELAKNFFENGLNLVFKNLDLISDSQFPTTIFYAFKHTETDENEGLDAHLPLVEARASTGWETMLSSLLASGFKITGTWPMRTERSGGLRNFNQNALASSIVLVCRPRPVDALSVTRREFLAALKREIPAALKQLQQGNIAPVDLAQAAIGPGMAIFSRYRAVLEADGTPMRVRTALALINQALDEYLTEQEGEYDAETRWALAWFEQYGHEQGPYGVAQTLSTAKNTSVEGLVRAGGLEARAGKVRLLRRDELNPDWDPAHDKLLTVWEMAQYLIQALDKGGEKAAGALLTKLGAAGETARDLAYRLYTVCERKNWSQEAQAYNMLVVAWPRLKEQAGKGTRQDAML